VKDPVYFPVWGQTSQKLIPVVRRMLSKSAEERPSLNEILASELFKSVEEKSVEGLERELESLY
jgi:serine/threonine protein kinase